MSITFAAEAAQMRTFGQSQSRSERTDRENRNASSRCDRPRITRRNLRPARSASGAPDVTLSNDFSTLELRQLSLAIFRQWSGTDCEVN